MGLIVKKLIESIAEPVADVAKNAMDNNARVKISNNELAGKISDNNLAVYQTYNNNQVTKFMGVLNNVTNIATALINLASTGMQAYAQIEESHEQTRRVQIQSDAYVSGKREETLQVQIQQEQETVRYLASLKKDLDAKRMELQKFESEIAERQKARAITQEQWLNIFKTSQKTLDHLHKISENLFEAFRSSGYENESIWKKFREIESEIVKCTGDLLKLH